MPPNTVSVPSSQKCTPVRGIGRKHKLLESPSGKPDPKGHKVDDLISDEEVISDDCTHGEAVTVSVMKELLAPLSSEIASLRSELNSMKSIQKDVSTLAERVKSLESGMLQKVQSSIDERLPSDLCRKVESLVAQNEIDKCRKQAMLFNLPNGTDRRMLRTYMDKISTGVVSLRLFTDKSGKTMGSARFDNMKSRDSFLEVFKKSDRFFEHGGKKHKIYMKKDLPPHTRKRNLVLTSKLKELQASMGSEDRISLDWATRSILVNGSPRYTQKPESDILVQIQ